LFSCASSFFVLFRAWRGEAKTGAKLGQIGVEGRSDKNEFQAMREMALVGGESVHNRAIDRVAKKVYRKAEHPDPTNDPESASLTDHQNDFYRTYVRALGNRQQTRACDTAARESSHKS
jgi:hypothetical protein